MAGRTKRYVVEFDGKPVTELGSFAGLRTAASSIEQGQTAMVSMAYPRDAGWLTRWAKTGGRRVLLVRDSVGSESYVVDVAELRDTSGDGQIFEALVDRVRRQSDTKATRGR